MPTVVQYQSDLAELVRLAQVDLTVLWREVSDAVIARELLSDILPELTAVYGSAAGTLAADWYDEVRVEQEIRGRFSARVADVPPRAQTDVISRWAVSPLFDAEPDFAAALVNASGSLQRLIADVGRETVMGSSITDPQSRGWQRVTDGAACSFCQMLAGRGAVYKESTVSFGAHDHCGCSAAPAFIGRPVPVKPYTPTTRTITDADRSLTRQWMRDNGLT